MNWVRLILFATLLSTAAIKAQDVGAAWQPATYHGIVVGQSSKDDVAKDLGTPKASRHEQDTGMDTLTYTVSDPVAGSLVVYLQKGVVDGMTLYPNTNLQRSAIAKVIGSRYQVVRYSVDDCLTSGGSAPLYENPKGPILHFESRDKGLAIIIRDGEGVAIAYVSRPYGPTHSRCHK
jgi:hypothetical protein